MYNVLISEILKLKRSKIILFALIVSFIPAPLKFIQQSVSKSHEAVNWKWFLSSHQELMVFGILASVILISCLIFGMEFQCKTISYTFTSCTPKNRIFLGKMTTQILLITILHFISMVAYLIFGYLTVKKTVSSNVFENYLGTIIYSLIIYYSLAPLIAFVNIIIKRYAISAAAIFGYVIMVFPFHLKGNIAICPFLQPAAISASLFNSDDYILFDYYKGIPLNYPLIAVSSFLIFMIFFLIGVRYYEKINVE